MQRVVGAAAGGVWQMGKAVPHQFIDMPRAFTALSVAFLSSVASREGCIASPPPLLVALMGARSPP